MDKKLYRSNNDALIAGVCGGIAEYFKIDSNIVRLIFVVFGIFGAGVLVYILLWIFLPYSTEENTNKERTDNNSKIFNMDKDGNVFKMMTQKNNSNIFAVIIIVVGVLFLLNNFFHIFYYLNLSRIWPIVLIIVGLFLIFRKNRE